MLTEKDGVWRLHAAFLETFLCFLVSFRFKSTNMQNEVNDFSINSWMFTCAKVLHRTSCVTLCIAYATRDGLVSSIISALQSKKGFYMNASMHCHRSECKVKQLLKNSWVSMTVKERWRRPWSKRTSRSATWGSVEFENLDVQSLRFSEAEPVTENLHLRQCITASVHTAKGGLKWSVLQFSCKQLKI